MDINDILNDEICNDELLHIEIEQSNYNRSTYIDRNFIFSDRYIEAIKSLKLNKYCTQKILEAARAMTTHHHGDKYEDLYFIDSKTNKMLFRTDYRENEQEVLPTLAMKKMARESENIISIHNHPTNSIPSSTDIFTCFCISYEFGLVICHNGTIYKYSTLDEINTALYDMEAKIFCIREEQNNKSYKDKKISYDEYIKKHNRNFDEFSNHAYDAGVKIEEVIWNESFGKTNN